MPYTLLVSYDIADDDRRGEVSDVLAAHGARVQYSVFEVTLPTKRAPALRSWAERRRLRGPRRAERVTIPCGIPLGLLWDFRPHQRA